METKNKIELLAPAGDAEKLRAAVCYGADAVYMAGQTLGLRANAKNFDRSELEKGIEYAHAHNVKVYVTANIFAHNDDFTGMTEYFKRLYTIGADAVIISDPGVFSVAKEAAPELPVHISTQANTTNLYSVRFWEKLGAERIVLARELSLGEIREITKGCAVEAEVFVHGAMCVSYSGRCLLSGYLTGRDSNRGDCAQPCRWKYHLMEETRPGVYLPVEEDGRGAYILNAKDLCMIRHLEDLAGAGVSSLKIEGRMKSAYYVATVVSAYREALDDLTENPMVYAEKKDYYLAEIKKASYRDFTTGFYYGKPDFNAQNYDTGAYIRGFSFVGLVLEYNEETGFATVEQRNKFSVGDEVEFFRAHGENFTERVEIMLDENGVSIYDAPHAQQIIKVKVSKPLSPMDMLRKAK